MDFSNLLKKYGLAERQLRVWALIPFRDDGYFGDYYDAATTRAELAEAFAALGLDWHWQPLTMSNLKATIENLLAASEGSFPLALNYCDGDEVNGFPGISVVRLLEEKDIAFTGADSRFYEISTSKIWMKQLFEQAQVATPPFFEIKNPDEDVAGLCKKLGTPLIVKPSTSAASWGLTLKSVVDNDADLREQFLLLRKGLHGQDFSNCGIYAERFVSGEEFTVFVVGSEKFLESRHVYPPLYRLINQNLPATERFLSYERYWATEASEEALYENKLAAPELWQPLQELAWRAHCAVGGRGYSRVDIRADDADGQLFVLEVNANCAISSPDDNTSVGHILKFAGQSFSQLIAEILADALERYFSKK
jgi:D-alanine-D-alanine ligase